MAMAAQASPDEPRVLRISRTFQAPRERLFRAFTDPERLIKWWGPKGFSVPHYHMEVRAGGAWRTVMRSPEGTEHTVSGVYREIVPPERLVFTWAWHKDGVRGHETIVTIEFHARGDATELVLVQQIFETAESRGSHEQGWSSSLECLADALRTGELE